MDIYEVVEQLINDAKEVAVMSNLGYDGVIAEYYLSNRKLELIKLIVEMQKRIDELENPWKSVKDNPPTKDEWYLVRWHSYRFPWAAFYDTESKQFRTPQDSTINPDLWMVLPNANKDGKGE